MCKGELRLLCLCGAPLNSDDFEYYCENCGVRFTRYVSNGNEEIDLISALNSVSKDSVNLVEEFLTETSGQVDYVTTTYTFMRSGQDWSLKDVKETRKVWKDMDPQVVSDEIQSLKEENVADFYFSNE